MKHEQALLIDRTNFRRWPWPLLLLVLAFPTVRASEKDDDFERRVRPLLIERCHKCHAGAEARGGLRLDSREAALQGGDSGKVIVVGKPEDSLLLQAVRHENGLEMPPDGKLTAAQIDALSQWVRDGAVWPGTIATASTENDEADAIAASRPPNSGDLAASLQLWLRADALQLTDGESVPVWPDQSGHGRDLSATKGIREGGVGGAGNFIKHSSLVGRPAVRFSPGTGLASSPGNLVDIHGDAALTMTIVMNLTQFEGQHTHSTVFCVGNPAHGGDPGKPLAALLEIDQPQQFSLDFAGGWGHDAVLANGSFQPYFGKPVIVTIVKQPGPMKETTRFYINGKLAGPIDGQPVIGRDTVPDIQHRSDVGVFLGKALGFCGAIQGDIGEVLLYNSALVDADRLGVEVYLGEKFGLWINEERTVAKKAVYTDAEKSHWAYQPVRQAAPPGVKDEAWGRTAVDRFTLAAFESHSLRPSPEIDKRTFLRRVTYDLTGLPPTPEEADAFLADTSPQALELVVDRLLKSPHYGERWGRHWLDLVRYAESTANDANAVMQYAWRYRNYVIDAFNSDLPYDQCRGSLRDPTVDSRTIHDFANLSAFQIHRRRLSAEELRDAMLNVSGQLDPVPGNSESGEFLISKAEDISAMIRPNRVGADDEFYTTFRKRTVYLPIVRNMLPDVLALFDAADPNGVTAVRNETTVASQGLFLLNHPFVRQQSKAFAERLLTDAQLTDDQRIELAHRLAYCRSATPVETEDTHAFLAGGGIRGGVTYGQTDEFGYYVVENKVTMPDFHATILHTLGLDHEKLTFRHAGRDYRLTDVHGHVVKEILN